MKKLILLSLLLFGLLTINFCSASVVQQDKQPTTDDVAQLMKANASLKSQLAKERVMLTKQIQQNENSLTKLKADAAKQQATINDLKTSLSSQQEELSKVPEAIAARSYLFGKKRILAVSLIILSFLLVVGYVFNLKNRVSGFRDDLERVAKNLDEKVAVRSSQLKDDLNNEIANIKTMVERQTTENKNRILALLADTNQIVHNMRDEMNKTFDTKIAALKSELGEGIKSINESLNGLSQNKTF